MAGLAFAQPAHAKQSIRTLVAATDGPSAGRLAYFEALNRIQPHKLRLDDLAELGGPPKATYQFDEPDDRRAIEHLLEGEEIGESHIYDPTEREEIEIRYDAGFHVLADFDPNATALLEMIVARILFAKKAGFGGASAGNMLGCIWLSPPRSWTPVDFAEAVYHESVHHALFLEETIHGVYAADPASLAGPEGQVISAIRREPRPFGASFHAACVAASLIDLFRFLELPDRVQTLIEGLRPSVEAMRLKEGCLNDDGQRILDELELRVA